MGLAVDREELVAASLELVWHWDDPSSKTTLIETGHGRLNVAGRFAIEIQEREDADFTRHPEHFGHRSQVELERELRGIEEEEMR